jgi:hypothetical protein
LLLTGSGSFWLPESGGFIEKTPNNVEEAGKTRLREYEDVVLERRYTSIQVGLIFREEWFEVVLVDERRALNLRKGQEKQENGLDLEVKGEPGYQPLCSVLEGDERANDDPVHAKPFQVRLRNWSVGKSLER